MKKILTIVFLLTICIGGAAFAAIVSGSDASFRRGCCSHHGGVSYCGKSGYYVCVDGAVSPTCRCR